MVFGFDDLLEGITIAEIATYIGSALFSEGTAVATESSTLIIQDLLGETGLEAVIDIAKNETPTLIANEINVPVYNQLGVSLWEEEGLRETANMSQSGFIDRVKLIASQLEQKGVNMTNTQSINLLKDIVKRGLEIGKKGASNIIDPKILTSGLVSGLGVAGSIKAFQKNLGKEAGEFVRLPKNIENDDPLIAGLPKF